MSRMPGWTRITLIVSLALNLAVLGLVAGYFLRGPIPPGAEAMLRIGGLRGVQHAMAEPDQKELRRDLRAQSSEIRASRRDLRKLRGDFLEALRREPYSAQRLADLMARQSAVWDQVGDRARETLLRRIDAMTPQARAIFADNLEQAMKARERPRPGPESDSDSDSDSDSGPEPDPAAAN